MAGGEAKRNPRTRIHVPWVCHVVAPRGRTILIPAVPHAYRRPLVPGADGLKNLPRPVLLRQRYLPVSTSPIDRSRCSVPSRVPFPSPNWKKRSCGSGSRAKSTKNRSPPGRTRPLSSSSRARLPPMAFPIRVIASPGRSRTSFPATARCAAFAASARPAGTRTGCRSKSKSARSSASTPRMKSNPMASSPSSTAAWKACFATRSSGSNSPSVSASGSTSTKPMSLTTRATSKASGGR